VSRIATAPPGQQWPGGLRQSFQPLRMAPSIGNGSTAGGYGSRSRGLFVVIVARRLLHGVDHVAQPVMQPDQHG
jgi:hypothetical protein